MAYDVASSIEELLFENNSVIIPNFGGFMLSYRSANIDHVQATLFPPSKVASFNSNLKVNDGVLVNYIKNQNRLTIEQAKKVVADHVEELNELVEKKEMIDIPKVGRLYKDYSGEIKFLPVDTNFNTNSFGLPDLEFHPILRNVVQRETPNATATAATTAAFSNNEPTSSSSGTVLNNLAEDKTIAAIPVGEEGRFGWARKVMPFLMVASLLLVAVSFYFLQKDPHPTDMESAQVVPVSEKDRLNTKPTLDETSLDNNSDDDQYVGPTTETNYTPIEDDHETSSTGSYSGSNECIIIVGQFSSRSNARKYGKKVEADGYEPFRGKNAEKGWNMVGVKFNYDSESEKEKMLKELQFKYDDSAWIYKE